MQSQRARRDDYELLGLILGLFAVLFILSVTLGAPIS